MYSVCVCLQFGLQPLSLALLFSISTDDEKQNKSDFFKCVWVNITFKKEQSDHRKQQ